MVDLTSIGRAQFCCARVRIDRARPREDGVDLCGAHHTSGQPREGHKRDTRTSGQLPVVHQGPTGLDALPARGRADFLALCQGQAVEDVAAAFLQLRAGRKTRKSIAISHFARPLDETEH